LRFVLFSAYSLFTIHFSLFTLHFSLKVIKLPRSIDPQVPEQAGFRADGDAELPEGAKRYQVNGHLPAVQVAGNVHIRIGNFLVNKIITAGQAYLPLGREAEITIEVEVLVKVYHHAAGVR